MTLTPRIDAIEESATLAITARAKALRADGVPVIGFGAGEPDFPTPDNVVAAAQRAAADPANHRYSPTAGLPDLKNAIAQRAARVSGIEVHPDQVVVANGGKHALYNAFMATVAPGDEVLVPAPYWVSYPEQIRLCGGVAVPVATDTSSGFRASIEQLEAARTPRTTALVFVSPSNPTGAVYTPDEITQIGQWAHEHGLWIITDEIYAELIYGDATFASMAAQVPDARERVVIADGVAKSYAMTGWRVGWTITSRDVAAGINRLQSHLTSNVANVAQAAALEALQGPQDSVADMRAAFDRRRRLAVDALSAIDGVEVAEPQGAFYVFPSFEAHLGRTIAGRRVTTTLELAAVLLEQGQVALVPGEGFGAPGYARISYALADDDLAEGIDRIRAVLEG